MKAAGHRDARVLEGPDQLAPLVRAEAGPGDFVVCLGAGNITAWAAGLQTELEALDLEAS